MAGAIFIPSSFLHFSITLIDQRKKYLKTILFGYLISTFFLLLDFTPLFVEGIKQRLFFNYWPTAGIAYAPFLAFFIGLTIYAHVLMYKSFRQVGGLKRNQIKYVFLGTTIGFLGGSTNYPLWYNIPIPPLGNIFVAAYVLLVAYAIIKYRLMDIKIVLTRAGIFLFVYALVLGIPFCIGSTTKSWFTATALAVVLATLGPFIYTYLRRHAEEILLHEQRRYQHALRELSKTMTRIRNLDELLKVITSSIVDTVKVSFAAIYIQDENYKSYQFKHCYPAEEKTLFQEFISLEHPVAAMLNAQKRPLLSEEVGHQQGIRLDAGLVVPCFMEDRLIAFVVVGTKPANQPYVPDDILVFETLSYSSSLAIENCIFWKEIEDRQRQARIQEMDLFSYSLAHEIDNPMTVVLNNALYLKKYFLKYVTDEAERKDLESTCDFTYEAAKRVSGMVSAIEAFGKKTSTELMPLKLQDAVESYLKLYSSIFKYHGIYFTKEFPEKVPFIRGVKQQIMEVLANLSDNAIHALLGVEGKEKHIDLRIEIPSQDFIRIVFKDNGYGITEEKIRSIFAPFVTTKASTEGRGMGLYNCRRIIERHKGKIWAESEGKGKGATFAIELPIAQEITEEDFKEGDKGKRLF